MTEPIPTRQQWTKIRDAKGGSAGMVKGVSVGKMLDDYEKATKGTSGLARLLAMVRPLTQLDKGLKAYKAGLPKKKTELINYVDGVLATVQGHIDDGQKMANPVHNVMTHLNGAITKSKAIAISGDKTAYEDLWKNDVRGAGTGFQTLIRIDPALAPLYQKVWEPFCADEWDARGDKVAGTITDPHQIEVKVRTAATKINFAALTLKKELQKRKVTA